MDTVLSLVPAVSAAAAAALVMGVAEGVALTAMVVMLLRFCPGLSAGVRSAVWTAALVITVLLPAGSLIRSQAVASNGRGVAEVGEGWALALVATWAVFSAVRLTMLAMSAVRLRQVWRRAVPVAASAGCRELLDASGRRGELCVSEDVDRPSVVGFFRPRVLLPGALFAELQPEQLETVVRHEMEHIGRRDDWINLLQKLSLVVFPLNPVLFWLDRRLCRERELACDDGVLRRTRAPKVYAACLANLAENRMVAKGIVRRESALALGAWSRETELSRRVRRILSWQESSIGGRAAAVVAGVITLGVAAGGFELARCPELLRFTSARAELAALSPMPGAAAGALGRSRAVVDLPVLAQVTGSEAAKPMLVNATFRESMPVRAAGNSFPRRRSQAGRRLTLRTGVAERQQLHGTVPRQPVRRRTEQTAAPRVVLTAWPAEGFPARLVLTVAGDGASTIPDDVALQRFAAFATRDGWLFVQL